MSTPGIVGTRSISGSIAIGCSGESDCANERCTNAHADATLAGLHLHADVVEARLHLVRRDRPAAGPPPSGLPGRRTSCSNTRTSSIVRITRVRLVDLRDVARAHEEELADVELVLAVRREVVLDQHAAARAQRQAVDVLGLVESRGRRDTRGCSAWRRRGRWPGGSRCARRRCTDPGTRARCAAPRRRCRSRRSTRPSAAASSRPRRGRAARSISRRVLGAVQAMQADVARIRAARRRRDRAGLPSRRRRHRWSLLVRLRLAGRRHQAAAQLADGLFPRLRIGRDVVERTACRRRRRRPSPCCCGTSSSAPPATPTGRGDLAPPQRPASEPANRAWRRPPSARGKCLSSHHSTAESPGQEIVPLSGPSSGVRVAIARKAAAYGRILLDPRQLGSRTARDRAQSAVSALNTTRPCASRRESMRKFWRNAASRPSTSPARKLPPIRMWRSLSSASTNLVVV